MGVCAQLIGPLKQQGASTPFPIQTATLPDTLSGRDVLGRGRTGSGKTLAFSIPLVSRLAGLTPSGNKISRHSSPGAPRGLVLAPTRELTLLGLPDGSLSTHARSVVEALVDIIGRGGDRTLLVAPFRHDGHPDHEAAGRAAAVTASRTDALLREYPIWLWH